MQRRNMQARYVLGVIATLVAVGVPVGVTSAAAERSGDVVRTWNALALDAARKGNASDARAARLYAMVNVAIFDAVNGLEPAAQQREAALVEPVPGTSGDQIAAAAGAAHDVLVALDPARSADYDAQLARDLDSVRSTGQGEHGRAWGGRVAAAVLDARSDDGSSPNQSQPAGTGIGVFRGSWSGVQFRNLEPFAVADTEEYLGDGPPALESPAYAAAYDEVKFLGDSQRSDPAASATFAFWALSTGTGQPPGAWVQVARTVSAERDLSLTDTARLMALQTMAMADTVAPTYGTKFEHRFWRPQTAINEGDADGNDATIGDTEWRPRAGGPGTSPEHWSGHSSFSAAGASIVAGFLCTDDVTFTLRSDSTGTSRTFTSLSSAAAEAGRSRVLGGIHFDFSNQAGLDAGRAIADEVLRTALRPVNAHVDDDACTA